MVYFRVIVLVSTKLSFILMSLHSSWGVEDTRVIVTLVMTIFLLPIVFSFHLLVQDFILVQILLIVLLLLDIIVRYIMGSASIAPVRQRTHSQVQ